MFYLKHKIFFPLRTGTIIFFNPLLFILTIILLIFHPITGEGLQEVVVTELPERIIPDSLYATGNQVLTIQAVRYRSQAVKEEIKQPGAQVEGEEQAMDPTP